MCGITGFIDRTGQFFGDYEKIIEKMADTIRHRGPDDVGYWFNRDYGVSLAHRRLSIIDLSPAGHQPMVSKNGRYVIVFNGEIYNFHEVRKEIEQSNPEKISWRGHSDTEVMLEAFSLWGIESSLKKFNGMFAFALWDNKEKELTLARDRFGEKPLYYGFGSGVFFFSSELKPITAHPKFIKKIDRGSVALYLRHNYIPSPFSIYEGICKLTPGSFLTLGQLEIQTGKVGEPKYYWNPFEAYRSSKINSFKGRYAEAVEALDAQLKDSVKLRMVSDVPLGAFLSGGIDSSLIVSIMQAVNSSPVKTFSIGFYEDKYNEAHYAKEVANHLGTEHTELYVTSDEARSVIPKLSEIYDEPFSDSSQIPTYLLAKLTKKHVTVSLSGDAGDEIFWGYSRYFIAKKLWRWLGVLPSFARLGISNCIKSFSPDFYDKYFRFLQSFIDSFGNMKFTPGDAAYRVANVLGTKNREALYTGMMSHWNPSAILSEQVLEPETWLTTNKGFCALKLNYMNWMAAVDTVSYLPDDILVKVDRASMAVSLESRIPFLDHNLVEFAWSLPDQFKYKGKKGKMILRSVLGKYIPTEMFERPKMGFGVPIDHWLRGPLKEWAGDLLSESKLVEEGFLKTSAVRHAWDEHQTGVRNRHYDLWDILMFEDWLTKAG